MSLASLQKEFPTWEIQQTPGGVFVAKRRRHIVLTQSRIDQGLRDCFIERDENALQTALLEQVRLDQELSGKNS